jgi:hypothetical protein
MIRTFILAKARRVCAILWRVCRKCDKMIVHTFMSLFVKVPRDNLKLHRLRTDYGGWTKCRGAGHHNCYNKRGKVSIGLELVHFEKDNYLFVAKALLC